MGLNEVADVEVMVAREADERLMHTILAVCGQQAPYLDVMCDWGWRCRTFRRFAPHPTSNALGVHTDWIVKRYAQRWADIVILDFLKPVQLRNRFNLVTAFHLDKEQLDTCTFYLLKGGLLIVASDDERSWRLFLEGGYGLQYLDVLTKQLRSSLCDISCVVEHRPQVRWLEVFQA